MIDIWKSEDRGGSESCGTRGLFSTEGRASPRVRTQNIFTAKKKSDPTDRSWGACARERPTAY